MFWRRLWRFSSFFLPSVYVTFRNVRLREWDLLTRPTHSEAALPVHIINIDIKDNHEEALLAGQAMLKLIEMLENVEDDQVDGKVDDILALWMAGPGERYPVLHTVGWL